jgi:hypothetical protein
MVTPFNVPVVKAKAGVTNAPIRMSLRAPAWP